MMNVIYFILFLVSCMFAGAGCCAIAILIINYVMIKFGYMPQNYMLPKKVKLSKREWKKIQKNFYAEIPGD